MVQRRGERQQAGIWNEKATRYDVCHSFIQADTKITWCEPYLSKENEKNQNLLKIKESISQGKSHLVCHAWQLGQTAEATVPARICCGHLIPTATSSQQSLHSILFRHGKAHVLAGTETANQEPAATRCVIICQQCCCCMTHGGRFWVHGSIWTETCPDGRICTCLGQGTCLDHP